MHTHAHQRQSVFGVHECAHQTTVKCGKNRPRVAKDEVRNLPVIKMSCNVSYQNIPSARHSSIQDFKVLCDYQKALLSSKNYSHT